MTIRISSDAKVASLRLADPRLLVTDEAGRSYGRSVLGETALAAARGSAPPLTLPIGPGQAYTTVVVFDVPPDAMHPRLRVTEGFWAERLVELFLIGDEDSILHKRTFIPLPA